MKIIPLLKALLMTILSPFFWKACYIAIIQRSATEKNLESCAISLRRFLIKGGPAFIKLGQFLSTRPNLLSKCFYNELRKLQVSIDVTEAVAIHGVLSEEQRSELIIDTKPIATGSIAQVYKAKMSDGKNVALKVLRPGIKKLFADNLILMECVIKVMQFFFVKFGKKNIHEAVDVIRKNALVELNMSLEAAAMDSMAALYDEDALKIKVPKVYWRLCSRDVLVMEWVQGVAIDDPSLSNCARTRIALILAKAFFVQFHHSGVFHADLHAGNIKIAGDGSVFLLDFGIIGVLPSKDKVAIAGIMKGFLQEDYQRVADIHFAAGYVNPQKSKELFALSCRSVAKSIMMKDSGAISMSALLFSLFEIVKEFEMNLQPQLLLLQKTMISLEGVICTLDSKISMWDIASAWFSDWERESIRSLCSIKSLKDMVRKKLSSVIYDHLMM